MKILNSHIKNLLTSLLLMVGVFTGMQHAQAQQYPVQGFLSIIPPYPAQLSDYSNPNINRLNLTLTLNDISVNNKRVRLKVFVLRQNSLFTQTSGNYFGDVPITLTSGIPEQLTSSELAGYFKFQNLQGIVPDSYAQPLGEGFMNIYFVVYDYFTGRQLSNKIEFPFFILLNDPPLLNLPLNGTHISNAGAIAPQIAFSWTSRATQVSNTDYIFTLSPIYDPTGDPFTQFLASIPVYQTTISNQTNLLYGFAEPPLLPGKTYGWRIQAKAKAGFEDVGLYKQNGYSEIHTFTYDSPCITIADQDVTVEPRASDRLYASWVAPTDAGQQLTGGYMVAYRKYSAGGMWNWQEQTTQNPNYYITGLEPTTDYEVKVARICTDGTYTYTNPQKATTLAVNQLPIKIDCGKIPSIDISNQNPLPQLNSGDVVMAGDFPVTILRANNVAGLFSGEGWVKVPYLADTKIHVTYQNIKVNTDHKLIDGYFETSYKASGQNIASVDTLFADVGALLKQVKYLLGDVKNWITDTTKTTQNIAIINKYVDSIKAKNPTLADSSVNATHDDLDSLQNISKTISTTTDDGTKNNLIAQAEQVAKDAQDLIERATNGVSLIHVLDNFADDNKTLNFLTITGKKITIPKLNRYTEVRFAYGIKDNTTIKDPICYLYSFKITPDKKDDGTPNAIEYRSKVDDNGNFQGYFTNDGVLFDNQLTISNTANNVILLAPRKDGLYIIKVSANIEPYKNNDPFVNYDNFSQKIITAKVIQRTIAIPYSKLEDYTEYVNDDYGLVQDFITKATEGHESDPEYFYTLKIAELHTAYRGLFDKFTDPNCYELWGKNGLDYSYSTGSSSVGTSTNTQVPCDGVWEQTMRNDKSILPLLSSDPVAYYKRFITDFIAYINNQVLVKNNFLTILSLSTTQADASNFLTNCSNDEISKITWDKRDILLRVLARDGLSDKNNVEQNVVRLVQYMPYNDQNKLLSALINKRDANNQAYLLKRFIDLGLWQSLNGNEFYQFINIISTYAAYNGHNYSNSPEAVTANLKANKYLDVFPSLYGLFTSSPGVLISDENQKKIQINLPSGGLLDNPQGVILLLDPYESITFMPKDNLNVAPFNLKKNKAITTSVLYFYGICTAVNNKTNMQILMVGSNLLLFTTGIAEIANAGSLAALLESASVSTAAATAKTAVGITDITISLGNIGIDLYRDELNATENGKTIIKFWNALNLGYAVGRIPTGLVIDDILATQKAAIALESTTTDADLIKFYKETKAAADEVLVGQVIINTAEKVPLGGNDISIFGIEFRKTLSVPNHNGNIAVFEYLDNYGNLVQKAFSTEQNIPLHSEEIGIKWLMDNKITNNKIIRIYSELEPCSLEGHSCKNLLQTNFPTAKIQFSYDYPGGNLADATTLEIRRTSIKQRALDLQKLLNH